MKILILAPSLAIHGGVRVIVEWANHLAERGHEVVLQVIDPSKDRSWIAINEAVDLRFGQASDWTCDVVLATTPPLAVMISQMDLRAKRFYLLQMAEDIFWNDKRWLETCLKSYQVSFPVIGISQWVQSYIESKGRKAPTYYIGNGVSRDFQPGKKDKGLTVLVEGWIGYNYAKDQDAIGPKVAKRLKEKYGARIVAFSQFPLRNAPAKLFPVHEEYDEYYTAPSGAELVQLYQRATIMVKASRFDARSCAPVEAMSCGTVTARALMRGDDDLYHGINCLRCGYDEEQLFGIASRLIEDKQLQATLQARGLKYREDWLSWERWISVVEDIFTNG